MRANTLLGDLLSRVTDAGRALAWAETEREGLADTCAALLEGRGEARGLALARTILDRFEALDPPAKRAFFGQAKARFGVDEAALARALDAFTPGDDDAAREIHFASEPRSQNLIRRLNRAPGGTAAVVAMREDLLAAMEEDPSLKALDRDFRHLLGSWFNRGFLELRRIDWSTSAEILERIIAYESVHAITGWDDLRRRVAAPDRQLYAFFHPALRGEPLIFVEVALTDAIPAAIGPILAERRRPLDPRTATTAVFYSISNCQRGLRGVSFGNFLIKQVVEELRAEFDGLRTFVTLSPVPGLRAWAEAEAAKGEGSLLSEPQRRAVRALGPQGGADDRMLEAIAARYLVSAERPRGGPVDPVARFHLGNGARLERINAGGDPSPQGLANSWGVLVNYLYDLGSIERHHEAFASRGEVTASPPVRRLAKT